MSEQGTYSAAVDDRRSVRFVRLIPAAPERVWRALTDPSELATWLAPGVVEPRAGGDVRIEFEGDDSLTTGTVLVWDPYSTLEYTWNYVGEDRSVVRYELEPVDGGTELTLEHRLLQSGQAVGYGAGWHAHLDALAASVQGVGTDWNADFEAALPRYRELAAG